MIKTVKIETPLGEMTAAATEDGICLLLFTDKQILKTEFEDLARQLETIIKRGWNKHLRALRKQMKEYFRGRRKDFSLSLVTPGTDFQKNVWNQLQNIPYGTTISYLEQAEKLENPKAVRAVASANGANRIAVVIPCHRVIGSDGSLIGYGGGLKRKRWLIDHERKFSGKPVNGTLF
jgi:AraC family transcriptional regulator of adaptative response/methylated-DNA-[protein]-cysteine methyltransferase